LLRSNNGQADKLVVHGILVGIEVAPEINIETVINLVADTLMLTDGIGAVECEHLGEIEVLESQTEQPELPGLGEPTATTETKH